MILKWVANIRYLVNGIYEDVDGDNTLVTQRQEAKEREVRRRDIG